MDARSLAVLLLLAAAAQAAPPPDWDGIISDQGEGYARSTGTWLLPTSPGEEERARAEEAAARDLGPMPAPPVETGAAPEGVGGPVEYKELTNALEAPGTGRIIQGHGGHDHVERRGGGLILDGEGRRLEILPVKNRLVETPPLPQPPDEIDGVLARLRALTAAGAAVTLFLTAWLWRRKDA